MTEENYTPEELDQPIATTAGVREEVDELRKLANHFLETEPAKAFQLSEQALEIANKHEYTEGAAYALIAGGDAKRKTNEHFKALQCYNSALQLFKRIDSKKGVALGYSNIGNTYFFGGDYAKALQHLQQAITIYEETGDEERMARLNREMGNIFLNMDNAEKAMAYFRQALKLFQSIQDEEGIAWSTFSIANAYKEAKIYDKAIEWYKDGLNGSGILRNKVLIGGFYWALAQAFLGLDNFEDALKYADNSWGLLDLTDTSVKNRHIISLNHFLYSDIYRDLGDLSKAIEHILRALTIANEIGTLPVQAGCHRQLSALYEKQEQWRQAFFEHKLYDEITAKVKSEEAQKTAANLEIQKQLLKAETEHEVTNRMLAQVQNERRRSDSLLLNILPGEVAEELKVKGKADAKLFESVTVIYTDFVSFTKVSERLSPQQLVDELHACYSAFDEIMARHNIEKIKTMGDAYMAVSGLPVLNPNHAENAINAAIEIKEFVRHRKKELGDNTFEIRIGLHSGSIVAGIVGIKKFAYDVWGDTVNTAARMEQHGEAAKINISETTYQLVKGKFMCQYRGEIEAKNKGKLRMYFVE